MKKILLYLLLACSISTFAQAEFPEGIQLGGNASTVNSTKLLNQNPTTGTLDHINATSLPVSTATQTALNNKADISQLHNPVTIGTANGLSLSTQQLSLGLASSGVTGALSGTDWNTFNGKFNTPIGLTTNHLPKWDGSGFRNSTIFDNGFNVGIGTSSPNFQTAGRTVTDINGSSQSMLALSIGGVGKGFLFYTGTDMLLSNESNGSIKLNTNGTQKAEITSSGNILFGKTTDAGDGIIQANGNITASPAVSPNHVPILSQVATLTGNQTIAGTKTFSYPVIIPKGVNPNEGVNKGQLDEVVGTSGTFTVLGIQKATYMLVGKILTIYLSASFTGVSGGFIQGGTFTLPNGYISADFLAGRFVGNGSCFNGTSSPLTAWAEEMSNTSLRYNISGTGAVKHKSFITISLRIQ